MWDTATWEGVSCIEPPEGIKGLAVSSDGKLLTSIGGDTARVWDVVKEQQIGVFQPGKDEELVDIAFSPDNGRLGIASKSGAIWIWPVTTEEGPIGEQLQPGVNAVSFSNDGAWLAITTNDGDGTVKVARVMDHGELEEATWSVVGRKAAFSQDVHHFFQNLYHQSIFA